MILNILATTDVHGFIHSYDYTNDKEVAKGLWGFKKYIDNIRRTGHTILIDIGDSFQGNPISHISTYMYKPENHPMKTLFEKLGYDGIVIGNHDFNYGYSFVEAIYKHSHFAYMAANVLKNNKQAFIPFLPVNLDDIKIAILAVTTPAVPWFEHPDNIKPYTFVDTIETIGIWLNVLKNNFDHIILLAHMGFEKDPITGKPTRYLPYENSLYEILQQFPNEFPIIFHGHTHERKDPIKVGNTWIIAPYPYGENLIHVKVDVTKDSISIERIEAIPSNIITTPPFIKKLHEYTVRFMNREIGYVENDLEFTPVRDSSGMEYLLYIMEKYSNADIFVQSFMGHQPFIIEKGPIKIKDVFKLYPYENLLYVLSMTGQEIINMLEKTAEYFINYQCIDNEAILIRNPLVAFYNLDIYRGFNYTIDLSKPFGQRVKTNLSADKEYKVAVNSYRAGGSGGYWEFKKARDRGILYSSQISLRDIIIRDILTSGTVPYITPDNNWYFLPECIHNAENIKYDPI